METTSLTFASPLWLLGLALLPVATVVFVWSHRRGRELVQRIVAPRLREQLAGSVSVTRRVTRAVLVLAALGFAVIALAQPRLGFVERETKQEGRDVIVAIDTSRSMLATDVAPTRLARAKLFTQDLVRIMQGDRVGLIAFAGSAFLQAPLTLDYSAVIDALEALRSGKNGDPSASIPRGSTTIAAPINQAIETFGKAEGSFRALVIVSDGEEHDPEAIAAAKRAAQQGIRIFTVGVGSSEGSLIPILSEDGRPDFVREDDDDPNSKPVNSKLNEALLREIAAATGGFYIPLSLEAARTIFQEGIEPMERAEMGIFSARQPIERFQWPLAAAAACLALSLLPGDRRRVSKLSAVVFLVALPAQAQSGLDDFQNGNYENAAEAFQEALKSQPGSRKLQFNAGTAAYKTGDFENAITHFTDALLAGDPQLKEDASYNLANSLVRKGEAATEPEAKKTNWKSAIEHYGETLRLNPENTKAKDNLEITKKLLEDLEKQQQQQQDQQQQDDQKQDQNKDQQDKNEQEQQKNDQQQDQQKQDGDSSQDEQQQQDGQQDEERQQDGENKEKQDGEPQQENEKDQQPPQDGDKQEDNDKSDQRPEPVPTPTPGEKKEGELKSQGGESQPTPAPQEPGEAAQAAAAEEKEGEISPNQARALLNSLRGEERRVNLMEQQQSSQEVLRDW